MMKYQLIYAEESLRDLAAIRGYVEEELVNPEAAHRTIVKIIGAIESLMEFPERGGKLLEFFGADYRFLLVNNYIIIYRVQGGNVLITRIVYNRRDFIEVLLNV